MKVPRTALVGGTLGDRGSFIHHTMVISAQGVKFQKLHIPWAAIKSYSISTDAAETRWLFRRYRELNITIRTYLGTYRFVSVARIPPGQLRGIFEYWSKIPTGS